MVAALLLGGLLLLLLQSLRRLLARASCPGAWAWASCCVTRWRRQASPGVWLDPAVHGVDRAVAGELLDTWQNQLPKDAPNYFALNILPADKDAFGARLLDVQAQAAPLYPVVPGRLISINGEPVQEIVSKDSSGDRATQRDLSLTWAADLPAGNVLTAGTWWSAQPTEGSWRVGGSQSGRA